MQLTGFLTLALASTAVLAAPPAPTTFSASIQTQIQTLQGYVQNVIKDYAQNVNRQTRMTDYSSTGRSLDFFLRNNFLPNGPSTCPQASTPLPPAAKNLNEGIAYMQQAQLALIAVSQDAINNNFAQAKYDVCQVIRQYGGAAYSA